MTANDSGAESTRQSISDLNEQLQGMANMPPTERFRILAETMEQTDVDDLSEEQAKWIIDEAETALDDLQTMMETAAPAMIDIYGDIIDSVQSLIEWSDHER